ncbi:hypothetical protein HDU93_003043 [Gonapodya sp. JEL0774]|nr:hypothetical protein HDU93_003043 [Gonapodya sp. JEL0774]
MARRRTGPTLAYFTCARESTARELVKDMLERKLIACAHILPAAASLVLVGGEVAEERESLILLNMDASRTEDVVKLVRAGYSPLVNVVAIQIDSGNQKFLNWITDTTAGSGSEWASAELNGVPGAMDE